MRVISVSERPYPWSVATRENVTPREVIVFDSAEVPFSLSSEVKLLDTLERFKSNDASLDTIAPSAGSREIDLNERFLVISPPPYEFTG